MTSDSTKIRKRDILEVFIRSFLVQSVWNYRSMISIGFGICLIPVLRRICNDPHERREFLQRHFKFFNAHPYLATYALGVSIRLEEAHQSGDAEAHVRLDRLKELLTSILGAVGDQLFWSAIRPASLTLGAFGLWYASSATEIWLVLGTVFLIYNLPHVYMRFHGLLEGYRHGDSIYKSFNNQRFKLLQRAFLYSGVVVFLLFLFGIIITIMEADFTHFLAWGIGLAVTVITFHISRNVYLSILTALLIGGGASFLLF